MVGGPHTTLNNLDNCQDSTISNILEENFILFYDWGFVDRGGFFNIKIPQSGIYGGDRHVLRSVDTPNYTDGKVWEGYRENWVWESGVDGVAEQPISISGVFVEDQFYATGNVTKPFYVDYRNGRVVFDSAIATTSNAPSEAKKAFKFLILVGGQCLGKPECNYPQSRLRLYPQNRCRAIKSVGVNG